jgi:hypothetical protein
MACELPRQDVSETVTRPSHGVLKPSLGSRCLVFLLQHWKTQLRIVSNLEAHPVPCVGTSEPDKVARSILMESAFNVSPWFAFVLVWTMDSFHGADRKESAPCELHSVEPKVRVAVAKICHKSLPRSLWTGDKFPSLR